MNMQQTHQSISPLNQHPEGHKSRGGRVSSPKLRKSLEQSQDFCGLEEDTNRYDLLLLVKRVGKGAGFSTKMINLLDYYMAFTRESDWEEGSQPIVYQSLSRTALDLGVSERQIQKLERSLFDAGALTWNDSGNHRRYGQRCPETGRILYAYGVDLTPLAYLRAELQAKLAKKQDHDAAWMEAKRQISWYRRQIRAVLAELEVLEEEGIAVDPPVSNLQGSYEAIAIQIRTHMDLDVLGTMLEAHKSLYEEVLAILEAFAPESTNEAEEAQKTHNRAEDESIEPIMTRKGSSKSADPDTHYNYTNQQPFNKLNIRSASRIGFQESSRRTRAGEAEDLEQADSSKGREGCKNGTKEQELSLNFQEKTPTELILGTGLQHITLKQALNASSERFRSYIPMESRAMNWHDMVEAAYKLKAELHISQNSWSHACVSLGRTGAAMCVLLTDQATSREDDPVRKPAAYFNAMINRVKTGELNLQASIFGHLKREEGGEIQQIS